MECEAHLEALDVRSLDVRLGVDVDELLDVLQVVEIEEVGRATLIH